MTPSNYVMMAGQDGRSALVITRIVNRSSVPVGSGNPVHTQATVHVGATVQSTGAVNSLLANPPPHLQQQHPVVAEYDNTTSNPAFYSVEFVKKVQRAAVDILCEAGEMQAER